MAGRADDATGGDPAAVSDLECPTVRALLSSARPSRLPVSASVVLAALLLGLLPVGAASAQGSTGHSTVEAHIAHEIFTYVNDERVARGEAPLPWSDELAERAAAWSDEMAASGNFTHSSSEFRTPPGWSGAGENIAFGSGGQTARAGHRHQGLMHSQGHRNNILQPGYDAIGIGISCQGGTIYVTEIFGVHPDAPGNELDLDTDQPLDPVVHDDPSEGTHCLDTPSDPAPTPSPAFAPGGAAGEPDGGDTPVEPDSAGEGDGPASRIDSASPAERAAAVARRRFPDPAAVHNVVLARDDDVADALAASAFVGAAPLLFTATDRLSPAAEGEIRRLLSDGGQVLIFGGDGAVSQAVERTLRDMGVDPFRIAGPSRIETAVFAAEVLGTGSAGDVALARAFGVEGNPTAAWADAISVGALAAEQGTPVLLTASDDLHDAVAGWLDRHDPDRTLVLGGQGAIAEDVARQVPAPHRLAGASRDGTAAAINEARSRRVPGLDVVVFNGYDADGWVDGLLAAGLAADTGATTLMVSRDDVPPASAALLEGGCRSVTVVGTTGSVAASTVDQVLAACGLDG